VRPLLAIDNYDSFTYNLTQLCSKLGARVLVARNDAVSCAAIERLAPSALLISPGPGRPQDAGISIEAVSRLSGRMPILGVCLGHQAIGAAYGARVVAAPSIVHGKLSRIHHDGSRLFAGIPTRFAAMRYHSLMLDEQALRNTPLRVSARSRDGVPMALRHVEHPTFGVQFHPESLLTTCGARLLRNFLCLAGLEP
jgi:anthranilate synthase/aminodeoxychorismate synthase-like glutamine amidotransferase